MPSVSQGLLEEIWYQACEAEIGIAVPTDNVRDLQIKLYETRSRLGDPELEKFLMCLPKGGKEIWIVRKEVEMD